MSTDARLGDPRCYGTGKVSSPLLQLAETGLGPGELAAALRELAAAGRDSEIKDLLAAAPSQGAYARLWRGLCAAIEKPSRDEAVASRVFAIPWVIVTGAAAPATVTCVLPDIAGLARVLEEHGVFGASRNLGLSNALCSIEALEGLRPSAILQWSQADRARDIPPAPIEVTRGAEAVHVRFLVGAAIAPAHAPDIVEAGANIGRWGTPALRAMAAQLAVPDVQILTMPRPPAGLYSAAYAGRRAGIETAFNLFMSNTVRRFRMVVGDPSATVSAHAGGELRITLANPLDDALTEGFRWPLHPADDLQDIERTIVSMIGECRLGEPNIAAGVLPDHSTTGAVLFPTP